MCFKWNEKQKVKGVIQECVQECALVSNEFWQMVQMIDFIPMQFW